MEQISVSDILKICNGKLICGNDKLICENFSKDTRTIKEGDVYVGIKGEKFDGNCLYKEAFQKGARICILQGEDIEKVKGKTIILVEDTIKAIQKIASYKRNLYSIPVIAVTGSVGKTSTKDIIASVMSKKYKVLKTEGNMNNHIGLPFTLLKLRDHNAIVVEMGMNHFGEIRTLTNIVKPTTCVITNIGTSHIGNLGSRENILKAKLEIIEGMKKEGIIVLNNDNDLLHTWIEKNINKYKIATYGIENESDITAQDIQMEEESSKYISKIQNKKYKIEVPVPGKHFVYNSLAAIMVGLINNIDINKIQEGIKEFSLSKNRMQIEKNKKGVTIINDTYNASFDSMKASIQCLSNRNEKRKIAVLGDMFELGEYSVELHKQVGIEIKKENIDILITVGILAENIAIEAIKSGMSKDNVYILKNNEEAIELIKKIEQEDDVILIKASNGMKFNKIVEKLIN